MICEVTGYLVNLKEKLSPIVMRIAALSSLCILVITHILVELQICCLYEPASVRCWGAKLRSVQSNRHVGNHQI